MQDEPVTIIDREVLKVLSVDTRMDIIKLLSEGGRTPSFVAQKLKKSDATIVEHLHAMSEAGLVKKTMAPGKKWVFYSLTERGRGIVSSRSRRLVIILATSAIAFFGGLASLFGFVYNDAYFAGVTEGAKSATTALTSPMPMLGASVPDAASTSADAGAQAARSLGATATSAFPYQQLYISLAAFLLALAAVGFLFYFYKKSKSEKRIELIDKEDV
jgi:DNA-binding transcriptional ArsR family regulator